MKRLSVLTIVLVSGFALSLWMTAVGASASPISANEVPFALRSSIQSATAAGDGTVWLVERFRNRTTVSRFTPGNPFPERLATLPASSGCDDDVLDMEFGPNGEAWLSCAGSALTRVHPSGVVDAVNLRNDHLGALEQGKDGSMWVSWGKWDIARVHPDGSISYYRVVPSGCPGFDLTVAADGMVWFRDLGNRRIGRIDPNAGEGESAVTRVFGYGDAVDSAPPDIEPVGRITADADGAVWVTAMRDAVSGPTSNNKKGVRSQKEVVLMRFAPDLTHTVTPIATFDPDSDSWIGDTVVAPDQSVWYFDPNSGWDENRVEENHGGRAFRLTADGRVARLELGVAGNLRSFSFAPDGTLWALQQSPCVGETLGYIRVGRSRVFDFRFLTRVSPLGVDASSSTRGRRQARGAIGCPLNGYNSAGALKRATFEGQTARAGGPVRFRLRTDYPTGRPSALLRFTAEWVARDGETHTKTLTGFTNRRLKTAAPRVRGKYVLRIKVLGRVYGKRRFTVR